MSSASILIEIGLQKGKTEAALSADDQGGLDAVRVLNSRVGQVEHEDDRLVTSHSQISQLRLQPLAGVPKGSERVLDRRTPVGAGADFPPVAGGLAQPAEGGFKHPGQAVLRQPPLV